MIKYIFNFLMPKKCFVCNQITNKENICNACKVLLSSSKIEDVKVREKFDFVNNAYASYYYTFAAKQAISNAKFASPANFLNSLLYFIYDDINTILSYNNIDTIAYIPAHKSKFYKQEFDLPYEIAKIISKEFNLKLLKNTEKLKNTNSQKSLTRVQRIENLQDVFKVNEDISNRNILVVDDIISTGSTISSFSNALNKAGANNIVCWAYAYNQK